MKKIVLALSMMHCVVATYAEKVRVACIGNSITYGHDVVDREVNSYPARLQEFLGSDYEVRNFGVSATTLLTKGDYPYITTDAYRQSLEYNPDIVLIKLGTNDSKPWNVPNKDQFKDDYIRLIETYQALPATPRIILLTPVRCFLSDRSEERRVGKECLRL